VLVVALDSASVEAVDAVELTSVLACSLLSDIGALLPNTQLAALLIGRSCAQVHQGPDRYEAAIRHARSKRGRISRCRPRVPWFARPPNIPGSS
jgi:hypothetical protein